MRGDEDRVKELSKKLKFITGYESKVCKELAIYR